MYMQTGLGGTDPKGYGYPRAAGAGLEKPRRIISPIDAVGRMSLRSLSSDATIDTLPDLPIEPKYKRSACGTGMFSHRSVTFDDDKFQALDASKAAVGASPGQGEWLLDHEVMAERNSRAPRSRAPLDEDLLVKHLDQLCDKLTSTMNQHYEGTLQRKAAPGGEALPRSQVVGGRYSTDSSMLGTDSNSGTNGEDDNKEDDMGRHHIMGWQVGKEMDPDLHGQVIAGSHGLPYEAAMGVRRSMRRSGTKDFDFTDVVKHSDEQMHESPSMLEGFDGLWSVCRCFIIAHLVASWIVCLPLFDYIFGALVVANAIVIGIETQRQATSLSDQTPLTSQVFEVVFFSLFSLEFLLRAVAYGRGLFEKNTWRWNLFDLLSLSSQATEMVLQSSSNFSFMRILRTLRLIRVLRLMRILRLISELRTLVTSILGSLKSLFWAGLLLSAFIYVVAIYLTQLVLRHRMEQNLKGLEASDALIEDWGTLVDSMWSLFRAVSGGADWFVLSEPLRKEIGSWTICVLAFYIAFSILCLLNVITGVFVESALLSAHADKDVYMVNHLKTLFTSLDSGKHGVIGWDDFSKTLHTSEMQEVFKAVDIDISEARALFRLLDIAETGSIAIADFIAGCNRLRGPAKSLELTILHRETLKLSDRVTKHIKTMEKRFGKLRTVLHRGHVGLNGTTDGHQSQGKPEEVDSEGFAL